MWRCAVTSCAFHDCAPSAGRGSQHRLPCPALMSAPHARRRGGARARTGCRGQAPETVHSGQAEGADTFCHALPDVCTACVQARWTRMQRWSRRTCSRGRRWRRRRATWPSKTRCTPSRRRCRRAPSRRTSTSSRRAFKALTRVTLNPTLRAIRPQTDMRPASPRSLLNITKTEILA